MALFWCVSSIIYSQSTSSPLTLDVLLKTVAHSYPKIITARLQVAKAQGDYLSALGAFDPSLKANTRSQPEGGYINNYMNNELSIPTRTNGLRVFAGYRVGRGDYPLYYQNYLTNSGGEYRAGISLPLLKNFVIDKQRTALLTQAEHITMSAHDAAATKLTVYQDVIKAYWQWVGAGLQLRAFEHLLNLAQIRQHAIVKQAKSGDLPRLAVIENQQMIRQRQQLVNQGQMLLEQSSIALSLYYRDAKGNPVIPSARQLPTDIVRPARVSELRDKLIEHPAIQKLQSYYQIMIFKQRLAKNELLPHLDATAYTSKQYGGGASPKLLPQAAMVGFNFKFPLYRREAKGNLISTTSELRQIATEKKLLYEQLNNQWSTLMVALTRYRRQIALLEQEWQCAKQVELGETKKFRAGDSTLFLVNQREQATTEVQLQLISARVNVSESADLARFFVSTALRH